MGCEETEKLTLAGAKPDLARCYENDISVEFW